MKSKKEKPGLMRVVRDNYGYLYIVKCESCGNFHLCRTKEFPPKNEKDIIMLDTLPNKKESYKILERSINKI